MASAPPLENPTRCSGSDGPIRRRASRTASRVAASQSSHSTSARAPGTVPWPGSLIAIATIAMGLIAARDVALAVGRIGQPVQEHHRADGRALRLQHVGAVPVLREARRMHRAALEVAVDRNAVLGLELLVDLPVHGLEGRILGREVLGPVGLVELVRAQLGRRVGVPELERRPRVACRRCGPPST